MLHEGFDSYFELNINYDFYRNIKIYNLLTLKEVVMKKKLLVIAAASVLASPVMAQSAFQGFYGQISTGYESNNVSSLNGPVVDSPCTENCRSNISASSQTFGTAPLVLGLGYNFAVSPQWLIGLGVDYSALTQQSSNFAYTISGNADTPPGTTVNGVNLKVSNRFNIFVTPSYAIDKDKVAYLKAGYSSVQVQASRPTSVSVPGYGTQAIDTAFPGSTTSTVGGYVVGLGYKQMITTGLYAFGEANYMSYSKANTSMSGSNADGLRVSISQNPSLSSYQLLVGLGYRF